MKPVALLYIRTSMVYFLAGTTLGGVLLVLKATRGAPLPYAWTLAHTHLLMVGWLVHIVAGVAYWMFPRPPGGGTREGALIMAYVLLNGGLWLRFAAEAPATAGVAPARAALAVSGAAQVAAAWLIVHGLWVRVRSLAAVYQRRGE